MTEGEFVVVTETGCHEWMGSRFLNGYGRIKFAGRTHRAHRMVYELVHGPLVPGMLVRHTCDNRLCVNPAHLVSGDHHENMADMVTRGRASKNLTRRYERGEKHPLAKLTDDQVREIRDRFDAGGTSQSRLAVEYSVSQSLVSKIMRGTHRGR
jgi:DNA-binding transcriptional regulator YiaG